MTDENALNYDADKLERICKAVVETSRNVFGIEISSEQLKKLAFDYPDKTANLELVRELVHYADKDLQSSKILHENGIYSASIFHLQQCTEKLAKAFALWTGFLDYKELYPQTRKRDMIRIFIDKLLKKPREEAVGHLTPRAFVLMLKKNMAKEYITITFKNYGVSSQKMNYHESLRRLERLIEHKELKLAKLQKTDINIFLDAYEKINNAFALIDTRKIKGKMKQFGIGLSARIDDILSEDEKNDKAAYFASLDDKVEKIFERMPTLLFLYPISIITFPHHSYSRYPAKYNKFPLSDYNKDLGVVASFDRISKILGQLIDTMKSDLLVKDEKK